MKDLEFPGREPYEQRYARMVEFLHHNYEKYVTCKRKPRGYPRRNTRELALLFKAENATP